MNINQQLRIQRMYDEAGKNGGTKQASADSGASKPVAKQTNGKARKPRVQDTPSAPSAD